MSRLFCFYTSRHPESYAEHVSISQTKPPSRHPELVSGSKQDLIISQPTFYTNPSTQDSTP